MELGARRHVLTAAFVAGLLLVGVTAISTATAGPAQDRTGDRLAGATRVETAIAISQQAYPTGAQVAYLTRHDAFADALAAGSLQDGPTLLVPTCGPIPEAVLSELDRLEVSEVVALGGMGAVGRQVLDQAIVGSADPHLACPGAVPAVADGIRMDVTSVDADTVAVEVTNLRDTAITVGRHITLEQRLGAAYEPLDPPVGPFRDDAPILQAGETFELATIGPTVVRGGEPMPVEPGEYRVRATIEGVSVAALFSYPPSQ